MHRRPPGIVIRAVVLVAALVLVAAACGDDGEPTTDDGAAGAAGGSELLRHARQDGITLGIADERPYGWEEDGQATGEAPTLAREVLARMGIDEVDAEVVAFEDLVNGLAAGRYDMIAAGLFITPDRAEQVAFADPDFCAATAFAVPEGNPDGLRDLSSLVDAEVTVGVVSGAVEEGYAEAVGVPEDRVRPYPTAGDAFDDLAAGRVDAVALTAVTIRQHVAALDGFETTDGFVPVIDGEEQLGCGAFAFAPEDEAFRDEFNAVLVEMREGDEILPVIERFGFTRAEVDSAKGVTVEDLTGAATP